MTQRLLHFLDTGPKLAPAVVLIHSLATNSQVWVHQVPAWSAIFRIVCVDLPGHGHSLVSEGDGSLSTMAQQVVDVLDHLQIAEAALVGISLGGMVAQTVALDHAPRVCGLVIAHAGARTDASVRKIWDQRIEQFEEVGMKSLARPTVERWFPRAFLESAPLTMAWMTGLIEATNPKGYVMAIRAIQKLDNLDRLAMVKAPTLVIAGRADTAVPPAAAAIMAQHIPNAQLELLDDTGHFGNVQQPIAFTEMVGRFLQSVLGTDDMSAQKHLEALK